MKDRRKHKRFNVANIPDFHGEVEAYPAKIMLLTFAQGGCGFWIPENGMGAFKVGQTIKTEFSMKHIAQVQLRAEVLYSYPYPNGREIGKFIGVKFSENDIEKIQALINALEGLAMEGKVKEA